MRGAGAIIRSISKARQSRQFEEAKRLQEEHHLSMTPIGENEQIEFDGIRRRRTIIGQPGTRGSVRGHAGSPLNPDNRPASTIPGSVVRRKSLHPPLGMSRFPDEEELHEEEIHPGFLDHFRRKNRSSKTLPPTPRPDDYPLSPVKTESSTIVSRDSSGTPREHIYGAPTNLKHEDTSYHGQTDGSHIQFQEPERLLSPPPPPPPHGGAKRQFSFQNPFHKRGHSGEGSSTSRPVSRGGLSFTGRKASGTVSSQQGITEEERLGLVHGDSNNSINRVRTQSPPEYSDPEEEWQMTGTSPPRLEAGNFLDVQQTRLPRYATGPNDPASPSLLPGPGRQRSDSDESGDSNPAVPRKPGDSRDRQAFL
jgi:hypothetical protein